MLASLPIVELVELAAVIAIGGAVTGVLAGLFGVGGGGIIVPVLYEVFRVLDVPEALRMQLCIGTSLAIIVPTTMRSYRAHKEKGFASVEIVRRWTVPVIVGVLLGSLVAASAPSSVFKAVFAAIAATIAFKMLFGRESWRIAATLPGPVGFSAYGVFVGLVSSLMGVGGGGISNAILTLHGVPIHQAVATSAGIGVPIAITGALGYMLAGWPHQAELPPFSIGFVSLAAFLLMAPLSTYTAKFGARIAHGLPRRKLEIAFGVFLVVISTRFALSLIL